MDNNIVDKASRALAGSASRRQTLKLLGGGVAGGFALATGLEGAAAQAGEALRFPVRFESEFGSFRGFFEVTRFAVQDGQVVAIGTLTGTVRDAAGNIVGTVEQALTLPLLGGTRGTCQILDLELGSLDLNLLGLEIHLDKVVRNIKARRGGGLLGDLLCAIADLLEGGGALGRLARLLNRLIALLG